MATNTHYSLSGQLAAKSFAEDLETLAASKARKNEERETSLLGRIIRGFGQYRQRMIESMANSYTVFRIGRVDRTLR